MNKKVALVLSGGGARGIAHIGVIEELEKQGFEITSIAGTSMGSLVGGVYALGKMKDYADWMKTLDKRKVFQLVDFTLSMHGIVKGDKVLNKMKEFIPDMRIEDLEIAYSATAFDLTTNKEVVFTSGSIYEAIRASISIPTVFTPVYKEESVLVDGGVVNNIPLNNVKRLPNQEDLLIAVDVNADLPVPAEFLALKKNNAAEQKRESVYQKRVKEFRERLPKLSLPTNTKSNNRLNYFELINRTIGAMINQNSYHVMQDYPPDLLINVSHVACGTFDFFKAEEMIEMGRFAAQQHLEKL
ncbi:MAG TPA: phospholipase [Microscillaceae bacterium]|nr:phospholipase [Microscillaceae bacterium]